MTKLVTMFLIALGCCILAGAVVGFLFGAGMIGWEILGMIDLLTVFLFLVIALAIAGAIRAATAMRRLRQ
jgi:hypothetical protein